MGVNAREVEGRSALRDFDFSNANAVADLGNLDLGVVPFKGKVRRVLIAQPSAGAGAGANFSVAIKRIRNGVAAVDLLGTNGILTRAAGDGSAIDTSKAKNAVATPAGCTKPVLSALAGRLDVQPGDQLYAVIDHDVAYGTNPRVAVNVLVAPTM